MANKLNLRATIGLGTKDFQNGVRRIQTSLNSLKMKFMSFAASLGAGVGLVDFARNLKDTAKKMDQSQTTLKNVSNSISEYGQNQKYIMELSRKYNQDLIVLTDNFSKFHASSDEANVSLKDQQKIFESMTRASAYFNLTADETNSVFLAITQMMSKGKVSAEELRRQLGERLPGAFGVMAKAAGMTTAELDKALSTGKLMSADILPKFAEEWNKITKSVDVNTIQGLTNKLKNSFIELTEKLNIDGIYKGILKGGANLVNWVTKNIKTIQNLIVGAFTSWGAMNFFNKKGAYDSYFDGLQAKLDVTQGKVQDIYKNMKIFESEHKGFKFELETYTDDSGNIRERAKNIQQANAVEIEGARNVNRLRREGNKLANEWNKQSQIACNYQTELNSKMSFGRKIVNDFVSIFTNIGKSIITGGLITAMSMFVSKLVQAAKEAKKIRNYVKDMTKELQVYSKTITEEEVLLNMSMDSLRPMTDKNGERFYDAKTGEAKYTDPASTPETRQLALDTINSLLNREGNQKFDEKSSFKEIEKAVLHYMQLLEKAREYEMQLSQLTEAKNAKTKLEEEKKPLKEAADKAYQEYLDIMKYDMEAAQLKKNEYLNKQSKVNTIDSDIASKIDLINQWTEKMKNTSPEVKEFVNKKKGYIVNDDTNSGTAATYQSIEDGFNEKLKILNQKLNDGIITQDEFNEDYKKLCETTLDSIYEMAQTNKDIKVGEDAFSKKLQDEVKKLRVSDFSKLQKKFNDGVVGLMSKYNAGVFKSNEEFADAMEALVGETYEALAEMGYLTGSLSDFEKMIKNFSSLYKNKHKQEKIDEIAKQKPEIGDRDTTFDYKKSESEIYDERAEIWKEYIESLNDYINSIGKDADFSEELILANEELEKAIKNCKTIEDLATLSKIKEDIDEYTKSLQSNLTSGINSISTVIDRLADDIGKLSNPDIEGWEKLSIILNGILQTFDGMLNAIEMFTEMEKLMNQLAGAEAELHEAKSNANHKELAEDAALMASKQALQTQEAAGTAASLAGSSAKVAAGQAEAISSGTASASKIPFPYNLAAIAAVVATLASVFASIPKFSSGGIFKSGSKTGDNALARLNSGEMILNSTQQRRLFDMLDGKGTIGGQVQFKVKGSDLVTVLNNYQKKITK